MSSRRTERLVNLVICLLSTRQYLTASRIRAAVPGYDNGEDGGRADEAFKRMFERDKADLRELGIPLEVGRNSIFDTEDGYRIARRDYELPEVTLEPDEAAAVGLATRLWQAAGMAEAARGALFKLRAAGLEVDPTAAVGVEPRVDATEPAFGPALDAVRTGQVMRFGYRKAQGSEVEQREVEPWGVVSWRGRWYLVGHDRRRAATRCFRLSRIAGAVEIEGPPGAVRVPDGIDLVEVVAGTDYPQMRQSALIRARHGYANGLRRRARVVESGEDFDVLEVPFSDPEALAERLIGYGAATVVLDPPEVREELTRRLRELVEHTAGHQPATTGSRGS